MKPAFEKVLFALPLGLLLAAAPVSAQQGNSAPPPPDVEVPDGPSPEDGVRLETFQDWTVRCEDAPQQNGAGEAETCEMIQQVTLGDTGDIIMEVAVGYVPGRDLPIALFTVPLGIRLPPGLLLQVDDNDPVRVQVEICGEEGCMASMGFDENVLSQFRAGSQATVQIRDPRDQAHDLPVSLMGFSAALERLPQ